jgi:hypothetical protein
LWIVSTKQPEWVACESAPGSFFAGRSSRIIPARSIAKQLSLKIADTSIDYYLGIIECRTQSVAKALAPRSANSLH